MNETPNTNPSSAATINPPAATVFDANGQPIIEEKPIDRRELSAYMDEYIKQYQMDWEYHHRAIISPLEVDELASKIANAYEQVRKVIDWKEENLLRRGAIERILKRRLISEIYGISILPNLDADEMAEPMILELMRSGYFDNGKIAKAQIQETRNILAKYIQILSQTKLSKQSSDKHIKDKMSFYTWMLEIAACEIEEVLAPAFKEHALINLMTKVLYSRTRVVSHQPLEDFDKLLQIYIGSQRALYNFDEPIVAYNVIKMRYPFWIKEDPHSIKQVIEQVEAIRAQIASDLDSPLGKHFAKVTTRYDAAYRLIGDMLDRINNTPEMVADQLSNFEVFGELFETAYSERKKSLKGRLFRAAIYSTLSIFVAGAASFAIFEGPVARLVGEEFSLFSLMVDLLIPSAVMFLLVIIIRPPSDRNQRVVKKEIQKIVHAQSSEDVYEVDLTRKPNKALNTIFLVISTVCGLLAMYFIFWIFKIARVPWTSMYIDTVNVAMVFFASMAIKQKSKEITVEDRANFFEFLVDLFSIPMAKMGQWFSNKWKEYNVVAALFTALIDTPFSTLITLMEDWRNFLKERSSEIH